MTKETNSSANRKIFKPKPWLKKPDDEKQVMGYYYVKKRNLEIAKQKVDKIINKLK